MTATTQRQTRGHSARSGPDDDRGQIAVLLIGMAGLLLMLASVVSTASHAFLVRRSLAGMADAAAVAGAQSASEANVYTSGVGSVARPNAVAARRAVAASVAAQDAAVSMPGLRVASVRVGSTGAVTVTLQARAEVALLGVVTDRWAGGVPVRATARARVVVG